MTAPIGGPAAAPERRAAEPAPVPPDPGARHRGFEREFERAIVDAWFSNGPVARRAEPVARASAVAAPADAAPASRTAPVRADRPAADGSARAGDVRAASDGLERAEVDAARHSLASACAGTRTVRIGIGIGVGLGVGRPSDGVDPAARPPTAVPSPDRAVAATAPWRRAPDAGSVPPRSPCAPSAVGEGARQPPATDAPPPIRLHVEADATGAARVWLGVDAVARDAGARAVESVREALLRSGVRVRAVVVNGRTLGDVPPSAPPRQDL